MKRIFFPAVTVLLISFSCTAKLEDPTGDTIKDAPVPVVTEFGVMLPTTVDHETELQEEIDAHTGATVRSGLDEGTRTALADKIGSSWPNYWAAGDAICVNGIIPQFFKRTVYASSVRERLDFDLTAEDQSHYTMLLMGDMAWDQFWYINEFDLSNYVECMAPLNGLPVFHTVGNHDSATKTIYIKVTDDEGRVYTETMTRPKAFTIENYQ